MGNIENEWQKANHLAVLFHVKVEEKERKFRIWQRDPLAVLMDGKIKFEQKLNYIHNNPLAERWNPAQRPVDYYWSSATFYETGIDNFGFLTHYSEGLVSRKVCVSQTLEENRYGYFSFLTITQKDLDRKGL